jgi:hypothetical protein
MTTANEKWHLQGDYFENCNCKILCPCVIPGPPGQPVEPTEGHCDVGFAFRIERGDHNSVSLNGLNFAIAAYTPGIMGAGNWTTAFYVDQRANGQQREALDRVLSGEIGGPMAAWMALTSDFRGTKYVEIDFQAKGLDRSVIIPGIMEFHVEGIKAGRRRRSALRLENTGHPVSATLALARGTGSTYTDHGMDWDNTGKNAHYAKFQWSWPK